MPVSLVLVAKLQSIGGPDYQDISQFFAAFPAITQFFSAFADRLDFFAALSDIQRYPTLFPTNLLKGTCVSLHSTCHARRYCIALLLVPFCTTQLLHAATTRASFFTRIALFRTAVAVDLFLLPCLTKRPSTKQNTHVKSGPPEPRFTATLTLFT